MTSKELIVLCLAIYVLLQVAAWLGGRHLGMRSAEKAIAELEGKS